MHFLLKEVFYNSTLTRDEMFLGTCEELLWLFRKKLWIVFTTVISTITTLVCNGEMIIKRNTNAKR